MHSYLHAIGFGEFESRKEWEKILDEVIHSYDSKQVVDEGNRLFAEMSKSYGDDIGITVCGEYDENDQFRMEYCFPYFQGTGITTKEEVIVERRAEKECFSGACDDMRIGVTLIFYLSNAAEYLEQKMKGMLEHICTSVTLSALSLDGMILLPIQKDCEQKEKDRQLTNRRNEMIDEARMGNQEAIEHLTMEDMDTYAMLSRRILNEDVFSIVDTCFMPYGMECDRYKVIGEILDFVEVENTRTGQTLYEMTIDCVDMQFDVCINKNDLLGEPQIGRRFKGVVWLQGALNF